MYINGLYIRCYFGLIWDILNRFPYEYMTIKSSSLGELFLISLKENDMNYVQITQLPNKNGFKTSTGKEYHHTSTTRLFTVQWTAFS